jgi:hypothetical protein
MISGFRRGVDDGFALLGCYTAYAGNLPPFRTNPSTPPSRDKQSKKNAGNRWKRVYIADGVGSDWFSRAVSAPASMEHELEKRQEGHPSNIGKMKRR